MECKKDQELTSQDALCPICFRVMIEPSQLPCRHFFCLFCVEELMLSQPRCAMCRSELSEDFVPTINRKRAKAIKQLMPEEFEAALKEYKKLKEDLLDRLVLRIKIGNDYEYIEQAIGDSNARHYNTHKWRFFVRTDGSEDLKKFIAAVKIKLHPTFRVQDYSLSYPFEFAATGWGTFLIPYVIVWRSWTGLPPMEAAHMLKFIEGGVSRPVAVRYSSRAYQALFENQS